VHKRRIKLDVVAWIPLAVRVPHPALRRAVCGMPGNLESANEIVNNLADKKLTSNLCLHGIKIAYGGQRFCL
jgi:hypothetical protein